MAWELAGVKRAARRYSLVVLRTNNTFFCFCFIFLLRQRFGEMPFFHTADVGNRFPFVAACQTSSNLATCQELHPALPLMLSTRCANCLSFLNAASVFDPGVNPGRRPCCHNGGTRWPHTRAERSIETQRRPISCALCKSSPPACYNERRPWNVDCHVTAAELQQQCYLQLRYSCARLRYSHTA